MELKTYDKNELKALKETYFIAKAFYETIKETAENIQKDILKKYPFYAEMEKQQRVEQRGYFDTRILNPFDTYLMSDEDFNNYLDLCYVEYQAAGIADKRGERVLS